MPHSRHRLLSTLSNLGLLLVFVSQIASGQVITSVIFTGTPANPIITINGRGFSPQPLATNQSYPGYTGLDYGTLLHIADMSGSTAFSAGYYEPSASRDDFIGLVISSYTDTSITYKFGSIYSLYYFPNGVFQLNQGDAFTAYVRGTAYTGIVTYVNIVADGKDIITGTTKSVMAGQQIALSVSGPGGAKLENPRWSITKSSGEPVVDGTIVGGFRVSPSYKRPRMGVTTPTDFSKTSTKFFGVDGGTFIVSFSCTLNGKNAVSQATFKVNKPGVPSVMRTLGNFNIITDDPDCPGPCLLLGGKPLSDIGISFTASPNRNGAGVYQWLQIIDNAEIKEYTSGRLTKDCVHAGLDTKYPYPSSLQGGVIYSNDNPGTQLRLPSTLVSEAFSAQMYLMWNPRLPSGCDLPSTETGEGTCTSISVPIGHIDWGWLGTARYNSSNARWNVIAGNSSTYATEFQPSHSFPRWVSISTTFTCAHAGN